jgi:formylglycine-generating enzyme required for sulfatase activity
MSVLDRRLFLRGAVIVAMTSASVLVTLRFANAVPGGRTRDSLSFSGTLNRNGPQTLTFTFKKAGTTVCAPTTMATPGTNGQFTAEVPIGAPCPAGLFDGGDVSFDISVGSTVVVSNRPVTPVPYARYADQSGVGNDCPAGYTRDTTVTTWTVCARTVTLGGMALSDEVVKVGTGGSAFWVDRYEASVYRVSTGTQLGTASPTGTPADDIDSSGLTRSGQRPSGDSPVRALSRPGFPTGNITWFQANEACAASGKQLPTGSQWLRAASGTNDGPTCNTSTTGPRAAADGNGCVSASGAHDMIGNLREWTDEWFAGLNTDVNSDPVRNWVNVSRANYAADATFNVTSYSYPGFPAPNSPGLPAAALRGGGWNDEDRAGVFSLYLAFAPSYWNTTLGFRCVVPR